MKCKTFLPIQIKIKNMRKTKRVLMINAGLIGLACLLCFTLSCQSGEYRAFRYVLAECTPDWVKERQHKARIARLRNAAEQGDAEAQLELGIPGIGVGREEAMKWLHKAADQGNAHAHCRLAYYYSKGEDGLPGDKAEAARWYRMAAELGDCEGQWRLGTCYLRGIGVARNDEEAVKWFRKAAEQDYYHAQYLLGRCYFEGTGVPKNDIEAAKWLRKPQWLVEDAANLLKEIESGNPRTPNPQWGDEGWGNPTPPIRKTAK
jgi:hypothetical protein